MAIHPTPRIQILFMDPVDQMIKLKTRAISTDSAASSFECY
jgi:hypothetical protein